MRFPELIPTAAGVAMWIAIPEYWGDAKQVLNDIDSNIIPIGLAVILVFGATVSIINYKKSRTEKLNVVKDIYKKIHTELKDGIDSLDGTLDRKTRQHEVNGEKFIYKHIYMNRKTFDGYVNSGDFNKINHKFQNPIQNIYGKIEIHDECVAKSKNGASDDNVIIMNQLEKELKKEIPSMMEKLKKYF